MLLGPRTSRWEIRPVSVSPPAAIISISQTLVVPEKRALSAWARKERRQQLLSPELAGLLLQDGVTVIVDTNGQLGTIVSSARFKEAIKPMDRTSEAILALQPVTFRYKHDLDPKGIPQFGLVAEQVEKVNPDLVARDEQGKPYTVRYEAINAMLLNEFIKEHRKVEEQTTINQRQEATIAQQRQDFHAAIEQQLKKIQALTETLKAQAAQIQKVSDQLRAQAQAPRVVANN